MNKTTAEKRFEDYVVYECPVENCKKPAGELCDAPGVWVHAERMVLVMGPRKPWIEKPVVDPLAAIVVACEFCRAPAGELCLNVVWGNEIDDRVHTMREIAFAEKGAE